MPSSRRGAVEQHRLDLPPRLPEAIDASLPLFEPVGVPRQVVVNDRIEMFLKLDPFAKAVSRDQNSPLARRKLGDFFLSFVVTDIAGNSFDVQTGEFSAKEFPRLFGYITGGENETAEYYRPIATPYQIAN
jgi:hypothetical protein